MAALAALLTSLTILAAAAEASVDEKAIRAWLKDPAFQAELRAARQATMAGVVGQLQALTADHAAYHLGQLVAVRRILGCSQAVGLPGIALAGEHGFEP